MRRTIGIVAMVGLSAMVLFVPGVKSPVRAAQAYAYPCTQDPPTRNYKEFIHRGNGLVPLGIPGTGDDYIGVIGDMKANAPGTCTNVVGPTISAILPANLENGDPYIVQFGLAVCSGTSTLKCGLQDSTGVPSDGLLHFVYICDDDSGGVPCLADGWVGGAPEYHDRYRFRIEKSGSTWLYTLQNITEGWTSTKSIPRSSGFSQGNLVWWAAETYDQNSQLGTGQASASMMQVYWMQYYRTSLGAWYVAWPDQQYISYPAGYSWPSYWRGDVYNQNYTDDAQNIWTILH